MSDETAPQPQLKIAWLIGTLAAFALFVAIAGYSSRMTWDYPDYDQQRADARKVNLATVQKAENTLLEPVDPKDPDHHPTAEWVDQAKGVVRIPIEEAMAEEINALKARPVAMGAVIPPPPAAKAAPAAGAPASTNAVPGAGSAPSAPAATNAAPAASGAGPAPPTPKPNP